MIAYAIVRNVHISARKASLVCALIRGKKVDDALIILQNCHKKVAKILEKLLVSAMANATNNHSMNGSKLYVYRCVANQGKTMKRQMPRAKGSANMIRKRHSHLEIALSDDKNESLNLKSKVKKIVKSANKSTNKGNKQVTNKKDKK